MGLGFGPRVLFGETWRMVRGAGLVGSGVLAWWNREVWASS